MHLDPGSQESNGIEVVTTQVSPSYFVKSVSGRDWKPEDPAVKVMQDSLLHACPVCGRGTVYVDYPVVKRLEDEEFWRCKGCGRLWEVTPDLYGDYGTVGWKLKRRLPRRSSRYLKKYKEKSERKYWSRLERLQEKRKKSEEN